MARPKKTDKEAMATVRIEDAFWKLLEEMDYQEITVLRVSQESGTNRNSFYYHYKDINDLARSAFMHNVDDEITGTLFSSLLPGFNGNDLAESGISPELLAHSKRIMLCARSGSSFLNRLVKDLLRQIWFETLGINDACLSSSAHLQVDFIFSGLVSVLGSQEIEHAPLMMAELSGTEIGKASITTMRQLSKNAKNSPVPAL